jgi:hypothetical protein
MFKLKRSPKHVAPIATLLAAISVHVAANATNFWSMTLCPSLITGRSSLSAARAATGQLRLASSSTYKSTPNPSSQMKALARS